LLPVWIYKRDGRLVPFEADRISRALFAATETLGQPDAFLARELTDSIVHFLAAEAESTPPTTAQLAELVPKVVRELGQPTLARAFADYRERRSNGVRRPQRSAPQEDITLHFRSGEPLSAVLQSCLKDYTLQTVFAPDLRAAHRSGLLTLTGLDIPMELSGSVLPMVPGRRLLEVVEQARRYTGDFLAIDGPEYLLAQTPAAVEDYIRELALALRATRLRAVVNLNSATPPPWAEELAEGPLFAPQRRVPEPERRAALADELAEVLLQARCSVRVDWHLAESDFQGAGVGRLTRLMRRALEGAPLTFVFDRPSRPVALAEGTDRRHTAVLLTVGLSLPQLAEQMGSPADPERFLRKLGSLARLARSAATQKRDFLRRTSGDRPELNQGFLLDRARLVVAPLGLEDAVRSLLGRGLCEDPPALTLGRRVIQELRDVLRRDGQGTQLDTCVDGPADPMPHEDANEGHGKHWPPSLSTWDAGAPVKTQLRASGTLQAMAEAGTAALLLSEEHSPTPEEAVTWLHGAWRQTGVVRLRLLRAAQTPQQLTLPARKDASY
jgi:hypothetical protein